MSINDPLTAPLPLTVDSLTEQLAACGLTAGQTVLVHMAMSKLGWVIGGAQAVILAFLRVLGPAGTLMMPTMTTDNTDPSQWNEPPIPPESWWPVIYAHMPAYDPACSPTREMGRVAELFRTWPGVLRSRHPVTSFAALGPQAAYLTERHTLEDEFGVESPLGRLYQRNGYVLLLGVGHGNNSSLHVAEARANWPGKQPTREGSAVMLDGQREWVWYTRQSLDATDFEHIGQAYEALTAITPCTVGQAEARFLQQRPLVDFAVGWMEQHRR